MTGGYGVTIIPVVQLKKKRKKKIGNQTSVDTKGDDKRKSHRSLII